MKKYIKNKKTNIDYIINNRFNNNKKDYNNIIWDFAPHDISIILNIIKNKLYKVNCLKINKNKRIYNNIKLILKNNKKT